MTTFTLLLSPFRPERTIPSPVMLFECQLSSARRRQQIATAAGEQRGLSHVHQSTSSGTTLDILRNISQEIDNFFGF